MKAFKVYRDVPWYVKESIGWPDNYDQLSTDQQNFIDEFYLKVVTELSIADLKEDLTVIKSDLEDLIDTM